MANDNKMLSCPICNNSRWTNCGDGIHQCDICETYFDKDENILLTEQEWLQTADTEQLAKALKEMTDKCATCDTNQYDQRGECPFEICRTGLNEFVEWLKQPHTQKE